MSVYVINLTQEGSAGCGICRVKQDAELLFIEFVSYNISLLGTNRLLLVNHQTNEYMDMGLIGKDGSLECMERVRPGQQFLAACLVNVHGMANKIVLTGGLVGVGVNWKAVQAKLTLRGLGAEVYEEEPPEEHKEEPRAPVRMPKPKEETQPVPIRQDEKPLPEFTAIEEEYQNETQKADTDEPRDEGMTAYHPGSQPIPLDADEEPSADRVRINPFPGRWDSKWYRVEYPGNTWHYITGEIYINGDLRVRACGVPGEAAANPPSWLSGFNSYMPAKGGDTRGYWLMFQDAETAAHIPMPK